MPQPHQVVDSALREQALRQQCERILHELQALHAEYPRKSLEKSIREVKALLMRLPRPEAAMKLDAPA